MDVLRPLSFCPVAVQCAVKLTTVFSNMKAIKILNECNVKLSKNCVENWRKHIYVWLRRFERVSSFHVIVHWMVVTFLPLYPLYGYFVLNEKVPLFDIVIPFINDTTTRGYLILLAFQFILSVIIISIMYSVDYIFILTTFIGAAIMELVEEDCKALTKTILSPENGSVNVVEVHNLLAAGIQKNQEMRRYMDLVCIVFEKGGLIQLYCSGFTLCVCFFVAKISDWLVVYFVALASLYQLSLYCLMGTMIEWKSKQLPIAIYKVPWHKLCLEDQKLFRIFLEMSQRVVKIKLMGSLSLNVETGMAVDQIYMEKNVLSDNHPGSTNQINTWFLRNTRVLEPLH